MRELSRKIEFSVGLAIILCAYALRVYRIDTQSLWPDEVYSLVASYWTVGQTWNQIVSDHVPLYTLLLGGWRPLTGTSAFALRYFSAICSTISIPLTLVLARRILQPVPAYVAAILVTISPFQIYYAQEAVMYSLLGALALLASWLLLRWASQPPAYIVLAQSLLYGTLAYTHFGGLFVLATHICIVVASWAWRAFQPNERRSALFFDALKFSPRWIYSWILGILLFLPWIATHLHGMESNVAGGTSRSVIDLITLTFTDLTFGYVVAAHLDAGIPVESAILQNLAWASLLLPLLFLLAILPRREHRTWRINGNVLVSAAHAVVPYALLIVLVQVTRDYATRYGFPATFWFSLVIAAGLWRVRPVFRWPGLAALVIYSAWGGLIYFYHPGFSRLDFRGAVGYIVQHRQTNDAVVVTVPYLASTFDYYAQSNARGLFSTPLPATIPMDDDRTRQTLVQLSSVKNRVWLLRWQDYFSDPHGVIEKWLASHAIQDQTRRYPGGLSVELWLMHPPTMSRLPTGTTPTSQDIGRTVHLVGFADQSRVNPTSLVVLLYWQLGEPLTENYTIFVHVIDQNGRRVAQADAQPYDGQYPTGRWPVGPVVEDRHRIAAVSCLPAGNYQLDIGLYVLKTMRRLGSPGDDTVRVPLVVPARTSRELPQTLISRLPAALRLDERLPAVSQSRC